MTSTFSPSLFSLDYTYILPIVADIRCTTSIAWTLFDNNKRIHFAFFLYESKLSYQKTNLPRRHIHLISFSLQECDTKTESDYMILRDVHKYQIFVILYLFALQLRHREQINSSFYC
jgi:hypothetical protein